MTSAAPSSLVELGPWVRAERQRLNWSAAELSDRAREIARMAGEDMAFSQQLISGLENGRYKRVPRWVRFVRDALEGPRQPPETTVADEEAVERFNSVLVPFYNAPHSMGGGSYFDADAHSELVPLAKTWLAPRMAGGFSDLMLIPGRGDSMEPTIRNGDVLLIDRAQKRVVDPDLIWAFDYGDTGMVKRLRRQPKGGWLVMSDNKVVPAFKASDAEIHMTGRVVAVMNWK